MIAHIQGEAGTVVLARATVTNSDCLASAFPFSHSRNKSTETHHLGPAHEGDFVINRLRRAGEDAAGVVEERLGHLPKRRGERELQADWSQG